jgi:hypothetical protein
VTFAPLTPSEGEFAPFAPSVSDFVFRAVPL